VTGESSELLTPELRLKRVHDAVEDIAHFGMKCFTHFAPDEHFEGSFSEFMRFVNQVPVVADWWSHSSARQGASLALALAKSYHPELNFNIVSSGFPVDPATGQPMGDETAMAIIRSASTYASRIEQYVMIDNFVPTVVPPEDSQRPPEHQDYETSEPFRASLRGVLTTYPPPEFVFTDPDTGEEMDFNRQNL